MITVCNGTNCSKREKCKIYSGNHMEDSYIVDYSQMGSGGLDYNPKTGETDAWSIMWCGDGSDGNYSYFKEMNKDDLRRKIAMLNEQMKTISKRLDDTLDLLIT